MSEATQIKPIVGWALACHDEETTDWYVCWNEIFDNRAQAIEFAERNRWSSYRAVRAILAADVKATARE